MKIQRCLLITGVLFFAYLPLYAQDIAGLKKTAEALYANRKYDSAIVVYHQLTSLVRPQKASVQKAEIYYYQARSMELRGRFQEALQAFREAEKVYKEAGEADRQWITTQQIARILDDLGDYEGSVLLGKQLLKHYEHQNDSLQIAFVLHNMAFGYYHSGKVKEALDCHTKEIAYLGDKDNALLARAYNQLGNIWAVDLNDNWKALDYYQKSLALKLPANDAAAISSSYNNIGITYKDLDQPEKALANYELALQYAEKGGSISQQFNPLINIANIHKRFNRYDQALETYGRALKLVERINKKQQYILYVNLGAVNNELHRYDAAIINLEKAVKAGEGLNNANDQADLALGFAEAYKGKKEYEKAYGYYVTYKRHTDSIYEGNRKKALAEVMIKYETARKDKDLLEAKAEIEKKEQMHALLAIEKELLAKKSEADLQESRLKEEMAINQKNEMELQSRNAELASSKLLNEKQKQLLAHEDSLRNRTVGLTVSGSLAVVLGILFFYQRKQKKAVAVQNALELQLAKTEALNKMQEERLRISRELHDNIGSHLTLINATVESMPCVNVEDITPQVAVVKNSLVMSMRELRRTVWLMNKGAVSLDEMAVRLRDYLRPVIHQQIQIQVSVTGNSDLALNEMATTHLFRMIQEAVNNSLKYAQCSRIEVNLNGAEDGKVNFAVTDNGVGFDTSLAADGNGLKNMQHRIAELKGVMNVESRPGETTVKGWFNT